MNKIFKPNKHIFVILSINAILSKFVFNDELEEYIAKFKNSGIKVNYGQIIDPLFDRSQSELAKNFNAKLSELSDITKNKEFESALKRVHIWSGINELPDRQFKTSDILTEDKNTNKSKTDEQEGPYAKFFQRPDIKNTSVGESKIDYTPSNYYSSIYPTRDTNNSPSSTKTDYLSSGCNESSNSFHAKPIVNDSSGRSLVRTETLKQDNQSFESRLSSYKNMLGTNLNENQKGTLSDVKNNKVDNLEESNIVSVKECKNILKEIDRLPKYLVDPIVNGEHFDQNSRRYENSLLSGIGTDLSDQKTSLANPFTENSKLTISHESSFFDEIRKLNKSCKFNSKILQFYHSSTEFFSQMSILFRNESLYYTNLPIQEKVSILRICIKMFFLLVSDYEAFDINDKNFFSSLAVPLFANFCKDECFGSNEQDRNIFFNIIFNQIGKDAIDNSLSKVDTIKALNLCAKMFSCNFEYAVTF